MALAIGGIWRNAGPEAVAVEDGFTLTQAMTGVQGIPFVVDRHAAGLIRRPGREEEEVSILVLPGHNVLHGHYTRAMGNLVPFDLFNCSCLEWTTVDYT